MWARLRSWTRSLTSRGRIERELAEEIAFHLKARTDHWIAQGLDPAAAARRARLEFGGVETHKEDWRAARGLRLLDELRGDLIYGLRTLGAAPAFAAIAIAILTVATGANIAVFNVLDAVLFRSLPVQRPHELREVAWIERANTDWPLSYDGSKRPGGRGDLIATSFAYPVFTHLQNQSIPGVDLMLFRRDDLSVGAAGRERRMPGLLVSGGFFHGLGVSAQVGRVIGPADERAGAPLIVVITDAAALRQFGDNRSSALGQAVTINGAQAVIVGVLPRSFTGVEPGSPVDLFVPAAPILPTLEPARQATTNSAYWSFRMFARLNPGIADERARAELDARLRQSMPAGFSAPTGPMKGIALSPAGQGLDSLRRNYVRPLYLLMAIMAAVLLIACANVAGLLVARSSAREREMGLRLALGAGRARLIRQVLTESLMLAAIGGALGVGLGMASAGVLLPMLNQDEEPITLALGASPALAAFAVALCVVVSVLCGLLPALRAGRAGLAPLLKRRSQGGLGTSRLFAGKTLIAVQVTLSLVLLIGAGLFVRTVVNLRSQAFGFRPDHLLLFELNASASGFEGTRLLDFYEQLLERVAAEPGVRSAAFSRYALLAGGSTRDGISVPGTGQARKDVKVSVHYVSPAYFATMGIPLSGGREFQPSDREQSPKVAIVNQTLAREIGEGSPLGRQLRFEDADIAVVGLAADARFAEIREPAPATVYLPYRQHKQHRMTFALRTEGDPAAAAGSIRALVERAAPTVPVYDLRTQDAQIDAALRQERLFAYAASGFAGLALLMACLGLYGTLAYAASKRAPEIGLRIALGAGRWEVTAMILRESLLPVGVGIAAGILVASFVTQVLQSMLFGLTPNDVPTIAVVTLAMIASALIAAWLPCRWASRLDPIIALRRE